MAKSKSNNNNNNNTASSSKKKKVDKPPPLEQYIKPAVALAVILVLYQFIKGILFEKEIQRLDLMDELSLRQVVFGEALEASASVVEGDDDGAEKDGDSSTTTTTTTTTTTPRATSTQNFVVLCHPEQATWPISSVFSDAASQIMKKDQALAEFRVVDCETPLPQSGKTLAERFKLNVKTRPTVFVSGKIGQPKQVSVVVTVFGFLFVCVWLFVFGSVCIFFCVCVCVWFVNGRKYLLGKMSVLRRTRVRVILLLLLLLLMFFFSLPPFVCLCVIVIVIVIVSVLFLVPDIIISPSYYFILRLPSFFFLFFVIFFPNSCNSMYVYFLGNKNQ